MVSPVGRGEGDRPTGAETRSAPVLSDRGALGSQRLKRASR
ncbi:hypothetical protein SSAG_02750 [Streptomyces sp. Mg1]|nr:hypothetical protein SSAG_02750 [Streptomyces sp. Mg1]